MTETEATAYGQNMERIANEQRARAERAEAELEEYRMRLAGALSTAEGNCLDVQERPDTIPYLVTCPTIQAVVALRRDRDSMRQAAKVLLRHLPHPRWDRGSPAHLAYLALRRIVLPPRKRPRKPA